MTQSMRDQAPMVRRAPSPIVQTEGIDDPLVLKISEWLMTVMSGKERLWSLGLCNSSPANGAFNAIQAYAQDEFDQYPSPQDLAQALIDRANDDAKSQRGTIRYVVNAYHEGAKTHFSRYAFRIDGGLSYTDGDTDPIEATNAGALALMMKHAEFAIKAMAAGQIEHNRLLAAEVQDLRRHSNKLAQQQYKVLELQQAMMDRQAERDLAVREQDAKEKRKQLMFEKFLVLLPIIAKKFLGGKGTDKMLGEAQLDTLLESFTEEQVRDLIPLFSDEQRVAFFEIYKDYQQRKKETMKTDADRQKAAAAEEEATAEEAAAEAQAEAAQSEPEPEPEPEPQPETVEASPEAAAEAPPAEAAAETVAAVEEPPTGAPPPAPEPDRTFELMVEVLGDDLNDEKIGRLAEKLDPQKRAAFLAAVEAKRTSAAAPVADAPVEAAPAPPAVDPLPSGEPSP